LMEPGRGTDELSFRGELVAFVPLMFSNGCGMMWLERSVDR
jgi:hypothetical protein